jgi:hypothetical protein
VTTPGRPLYFRVLGVRHLRVNPVVVFLLFEGSIAVGALLALADIVNVWGVIAIPVAVAIMVKVHDRVARALVQPLAVVQMGATRPLRERPSVGRSPVPGSARLTGEIAGDDAVSSPEARPDSTLATDSDGHEATAIGVARVTGRGRAAVPARPTPGPRSPAETSFMAETASGPPLGEGAALPDGAGPLLPNGPLLPKGPLLPGGPLLPNGPLLRNGPLLPGGPLRQDAVAGRPEMRPDPGSMRAEPMPFRADRLEGDWRNQGHFDA